MNVSFTRARSKLIIFGSRKTLQSAPLLQEFLMLMEEKGWILPLPPKADVLHPALSGCALKRGAENIEAKENVTRPQKKPKVQDGLLRSRPILRDLVNAAIS